MVLVCLAAALLLIGLRILCPLAVVLFRHLLLVRLLGDCKRLRQLGSWAAVTGATDGIGREYARGLARAGINIVLLSRSEDRLKIVAEEIRQEFQVEVMTIQADFTKVDIYENIKQRLSTLDLGIVVNNVGMTQKYPNEFHSYPIDDCPDFFLNILRCNALSAVKMTQCVLPGMTSRRKGLIINISSGSALQPVPLSTMYTSTKRFLEMFSTALNVECAASGVTIQTVLPFFVQTKFIGRFKPPRFGTPNAEEYVKQALPLALVEGRSYGCLTHAIQALITLFVPQSFRIYFGYRLQKKRKDILLENQ